MSNRILRRGNETGDTRAASFLYIAGGLGGEGRQSRGASECAVRVRLCACGWMAQPRTDRPTDDDEKESERARLGTAARWHERMGAHALVRPTFGIEVTSTGAARRPAEEENKQGRRQ